MRQNTKIRKQEVSNCCRRQLADIMKYCGVKRARPMGKSMLLDTHLTGDSRETVHHHTQDGAARECVHSPRKVTKPSFECEAHAQLLYKRGNWLNVKTESIYPKHN